MSKVLMFKATKKLRYYNSVETGVVKDGEMCEVDDDLGAKLLKWYPDNFFDLEAGDIEEVVSSDGEAVTKDVSDEKKSNKSRKKSNKKSEQ